MLTDILVYFSHAAVVVFAALSLLWAVSILVKDASLVDIFWGFGFLLVASVCLYIAASKTPYQILLAALPIIWGLRLTLYLAKRNLGFLGGHGGEDKRYIAMRKRAEKKGMSEGAWRLRSLLTIYFGQGLLIMIVSAPVWVAMATGWVTFDFASVLDIAGSEGKSVAEGLGYIEDSVKEPVLIGLFSILGAALWLIGFLFEAIGDAQLASFLKKNKNYDGPYEDKPVLDTGLWKYTRHPNYFGNACMWWGIWLVACQAPWGWTTIFAPLIMTLLLVKISGKDLLERQLKKRPAYADYMKRTSGFIPKRPKG